MPYISSHDPRTPTIQEQGISERGNATTWNFTARYSVTGFNAFTVADGIEARLIEAEAALHAGDPTTMLQKLNHLRDSAMVPNQTGSLSDTTDPGTPDARVSLLFQERAYWLFATGHRQGDLRRLIRQYGRSQDQVYPTGQYLGGGTGLYGSDVTAPIPSGEDANPLFHGCSNRGA